MSTRPRNARFGVSKFLTRTLSGQLVAFIQQLVDLRLDGAPPCSRIERRTAVRSRSSESTVSRSRISRQRGRRVDVAQFTGGEHFHVRCCTSRLAPGNAYKQTHSATSSNSLCTTDGLKTGAMTPSRARGRPRSEEHSSAERKFLSDKVYRRNDRGIVGVESLSLQGLAFVVSHTVLDVRRRRTVPVRGIGSPFVEQLIGDLDPRRRRADLGQFADDRRVSAGPKLGWAVSAGPTQRRFGHRAHIYKNPGLNPPRVWP
jgi:hypothetical protein